MFDFLWHLSNEFKYFALYVLIFLGGFVAFWVLLTICLLCKPVVTEEEEEQEDEVQLEVKRRSTRKLISEREIKNLE